VQTDDHGFAAWVTAAAAGTAAEPLVAGLFGPHRRLYKRVASFDAAHQPEVHAAFAGQTYERMVAACSRLAADLSRHSGRRIAADAVLIDAPPAEREVEFRLQVRERAEHDATRPHRWRRLEDLSPVVRSLAHEQFDDLVKRVRIFVAPDVADAVRGCGSLERLLLDAAPGA
jgi:hypothetical protein